MVATESPRIGKNRHAVLITFSPVSVPDNISNFHVMVSWDIPTLV